MASSSVESIQVAIRIRPFLSREEDREEAIDFDDRTVRITHSKHQVESQYDQIFGPLSQQRDIYGFYRDALVESAKGYNVTIFAYGQTGSGKTYTMFGADWETNNPAPQVYYGNEQESARQSSRLLAGPHPLDDPSKHGIIPNTITTIFDQVQNQAATVYCSFAQLYNEKIFDLLQDADRQKPMNIRQDSVNGIFVENQAEYVVTSVADCLTLLKRGDRNRVVRQTRFNQHSSRSHTIFQLLIEYEKANSKGSLKRAKINLCDLAGSEKFDSLMEGMHLREMTNINQSLSTLGKVISALGKKQTKHIPYRESKLTRLLEDSLGVNTRTLLIAAVSPSAASVEETVNTLKFADRAKQVMIHLKKNEVQATGNEMVNRLQREVQHLKELLEIKNKGNGSMKSIQHQLWALKEENFKLKKITHNLTVDEVETMMKENKEMRLQLQRVSTTESAATTQSFFMTQPEDSEKPSSAHGNMQSPPRESPKVNHYALPPSAPKALPGAHKPKPPAASPPQHSLPKAKYPPAPPQQKREEPKEPKLPPVSPEKVDLPRLVPKSDIHHLEQEIQNAKLDEIKQSANQLQSVMIFQGRCPICTLVPPCRHYQSSSEFPAPMPVQQIVKPTTRLPENPGITDIIPIGQPQRSANQTSRSFTKSPRVPSRPNQNPTGSTTVRYRGRTVEHKTANVFMAPQEKDIQANRKKQNRILQRKLQDIEKIERWREQKLAKEIERIEAERKEEEEKAEAIRKKDEQRMKYLERQKQKLNEFEDIKQRKATIEALEKQKEDKRQMRVTRRQAVAQKKTKKQIMEYREKKRLIDGIINDQVASLESDALYRSSLEGSGHTPSALDVTENS